jgi:hypothetical protein
LIAPLQVGLNVVLYSGRLEPRLVFLMIVLCLFCTPLCCAAA